MMSGVPETFTEKQEKLGRPCSPDVKIYKFSATAISSISNRITGCILSGGIYLTKWFNYLVLFVFFLGIVGVGALSLVGVDVAGLFSTLGNVPVVGHILKLGVAFPLIFHYLGGVRHVAWDQKPELLENDKVEKSSYLVFGVSAALTLPLIFI